MIVVIITTVVLLLLLLLLVSLSILLFTFKFFICRDSFLVGMFLLCLLFGQSQSNSFFSKAPFVSSRVMSWSFCLPRDTLVAEKERGSHATHLRRHRIGNQKFRLFSFANIFRARHARERWPVAEKNDSIHSTTYCFSGIKFSNRR